MTDFIAKGFQNRYTMSPWNCNCTAMALQGRDGTVWLLTGTGGADPQGLVPCVIPGLSHSSEFMFDRTNFRKLYYVEGRRLKWIDIGDFNNGGVVHEFTEYTRITGLGESDVSADGLHFALCGDGKEIFLYPESGIRVPFAQGAESLYVTPDNNIVISWEGQWLFSPPKMTLRRLTAQNGHKAVGRDAQGREVLFWCNAAENPVTLPDFPNGVVSIDLATGKQTGLISLPWSYAMHISACRLPFILVAAYMPIVAGHAQILKVGLDGAVETVHEWDGDFSRYELQPHAALSFDGSRACWTEGADTRIRVF